MRRGRRTAAEARVGDGDDLAGSVESGHFGGGRADDRSPSGLVPCRTDDERLHRRNTWDCREFLGAARIH